MTTFSDILGGPREIEVRGLKLTYRPEAMTPNTLTRILKAGSVEDGSEQGLMVMQAYRETIPTFVVKWDLENEGKPVPVTAEGIDGVPFVILDMVFEAIMEDRRERASEEGNVSAASSIEPPPASTTPSSTETHPNGSATSPLPVSIVSGSGSS